MLLMFINILAARYRQQIEQAQSYYRHAAHLVPYNGEYKLIIL